MNTLLRQTFAAVLDALSVDQALGGAVAGELRALAGRGPMLVIAFGKAARPMAHAVLAQLPAARLRGLIVPPEPDAAPLPPFEVLAGGHPLPTAGSFAAARRALELARSAHPDETVLFLVSGGGSAMLELPADPGVTLDEQRALYRALVGCGAGIAAINTVRRHLSAIKGGRLALAARAARVQRTLAIADVPHADATSLASGPTTSDPTVLADCRAVLDRLALWPAVPPALRARLARGDLPPPLLAADELVARSAFHIVLDERAAAAAAAQHLAAHGVSVTAARDVDDWPYARAADDLLGQLAAACRSHPGRPVALVTTGELSVPLPADPGVGGRNLQFALACARRIAGQPVAVLSCGTDGIDGNAPAAGAVVDGTTLARAAAAGFDAATALARCDAFPLLHAIGDAVVTGPTGCNVRDLRILLAPAAT